MKAALTTDRLQKRNPTLVTTNEWCIVWTFGHPDDPDEELGQLESGEPVLLLGEKILWPDDVSFREEGHFMMKCLTRFGVGWLGELELSL